ncbi:hypothetical protein EGY16_30180 [Burkholderia pseudomallei]|nr:hypothetical protein EGY16_30180 [Burkholderia pseudomallei]NAX53976.1 hypothetical protein [Burkholderia pseudomallei]NAY57888.1 hypothetical protein [Burkholderia pseudomallei]NAY64351.1 hypothetical protein [Burkholderia pseudomallei]NAY70974.1 hypothetical protein [Burkholderia pseudomallei]
MIRAIRVAGGDVARIGDVADILVCKTGIESLRSRSRSRSRSPRLALPCLALPCRAVAVPRNCRAFRRLAGLPRVTGRSAAQRLSR